MDLLKNYKNSIFILLGLLLSCAANAKSIFGSYHVKSMSGCYSQTNENSPITEDYSYTAVAISFESAQNLLNLQYADESGPLPLQTQQHCPT